MTTPTSSTPTERPEQTRKFPHVHLGALDLTPHHREDGAIRYYYTQTVCSDSHGIEPDESNQGGRVGPHVDDWWMEQHRG